MRKEITVDGILNVYKPKEWTSHDIVAKIKKDNWTKSRTHRNTRPFWHKGSYLF